jgi:hypothetical protein
VHDFGYLCHGIALADDMATLDTAANTLTATAYIAIRTLVVTALTTPRLQHGHHNQHLGQYGHNR